MVSCEIFSEDTHGPEFFKRLVERLKKCYSFGIHFAGDKPSKALNERCKEKRGSKSGYEKWQLPKFAENFYQTVCKHKDKFYLQNSPFLLFPLLL